MLPTHPQTIKTIITSVPTLCAHNKERGLGESDIHRIYRKQKRLYKPLTSHTRLLGSVGLVSLSVDMQPLSLDPSYSNISIFAWLLDKESYNSF